MHARSGHAAHDHLPAHPAVRFQRRLRGHLRHGGREVRALEVPDPRLPLLSP